MAEPYELRPAEAPERNWVPMVIGLTLVILIVAGIALVSRNAPKPPVQENPYAANLKMSDAAVSAAKNFVGATVTYLDFKLTNAGSQTVLNGQIEASFKNTLGEVVQKEVVPIHVLQPQLGGFDDVTDLSMSPLTPGEAKTVRLTLEHVSIDWNQSVPDIRFVNLQTK